ncbi:MAG: sulfatase [Sedimentisphaerales bacterium]|nr:sulfatase [Sedimentisphaerales bacterium]
MNDQKCVNRRNFLGRAGEMSVGLLLGGYDPSARGSSSHEGTETRRPNILFVFADQLRYSAMGSSGNRVVRTPHFDRLASQGLVFENALSSHPLCSPYRAQILTGKYGFANGVPDNEYLLWDNQVTLPRALKAAGYFTAYVGKWHLGKGPYTKEKRHGFDYMFSFNCLNRHYGATYHENEAGPVTIEKFAPEGETDRTIQLMEDHINKRGHSPFAIVLSWEPPHWPYDKYPEQYDIYDPAQIDLHPNVPRQMAEFARREIAQYYGNVTAIDAQMGRLMDTLDRLGIAEDTIVCFSSDHGDHLSSHGYGKPMDRWMHPTKRASKSTPFDEAVHIPFIMRYPRKVNAGRRTRVMFSSVDVMPTLLSLCGIEIPDGVQGHSLAHIVTGQDGPKPPDSVYLMNMGNGWPNRERWVGCWRGVRTDRWVYARWYRAEDHEPVLFDRQNDPYERKNLAGNPKFAGIQQEMEARLKRWMAETGDPFETGRREPKRGMLDMKFTLQPQWLEADT